MWQLRTYYGLTVEQFDAMRAAQNDACAICFRAFTTPYVDHDHVTGLVRGLLCSSCNKNLGVFEKPGYAEACAAYLDRHEKSKRQIG